MVHIVRSCALLVIALTATPPQLGAQSASRSQSITVRLYDMFNVSAHEMKTAQRVVADIFDHAGLKVAWRMCRSALSATSPAACNMSVEPNEVMVRIAVAPEDMDAVVLGYSFVDQETRMGTLSMVLADRVKRQAARARIPFDTLLGRTIAHELGHLVLGTTDHTDDGLMQARWTDRALRLSMMRDVRFSPFDAERMAAMLATRRPATETASAALAVVGQTAASR